MIILKLGGSLITDKSKKFVIRKRAVERVTKEIKESRALQNGLIIVHGGGSFGHPVAKEYGLNAGVVGPSQLEGVAATRSAMTKLNTYVIGALVKGSIPAVAVHTSAVAVCNSGRISSFEFGSIKNLLFKDMVPVLYGDVVADDELNFSILSGDQIVTYLSMKLKPERIILATDVDGVFTKDPKESIAGKEKARLIPELTQQELDTINYGKKNDATGGIRGKLEELVSLAENGYESYIINALEKDRLRKALSGKDVIGTRVGV
ncbi:MAG: isopentenyl phosphate kinase [Candidatus Hydrothermarchaeales archaeon]